MTSSFLSYLLGYFSVNCTSAAVLWAVCAEGRIDETTTALFFLVYALISCAGQLPLGMLSDKIKSNGRIFAAAGCILCAAGPILADNYMIWPSAGVLAVGTALFVTGAGTDSLTQNPGYTRNGILFASGAVGTAFGIKISDVSFFPSLYLILALIFSAALIYFFCRHSRESFELFLPAEPGKEVRPSLISQNVILIFLTFVTVLARSWAGMAVTAAESDSKFIWLLPCAALAAGILAGGIAADLFTPDLSNSFFFFAASLAVTKAGASTLFYLVFLFLCGLTLPATLGNIAMQLRGKEGFAMGLFSAACLCGEFAARTVKPAADSFTAKYGISAVLLACAVLSFLCLPRIRSTKKPDSN